MPGLPITLPHGVQPRTTLTDTNPGAGLFNEYIDSNGVQTHEPQYWIKVYNGTSGALTKGGVYMVVYDGDEETNPKLAAPATVAADAQVVVATAASADATWCWVVVSGYVDALVEGTTDVAKDDFLKATNAQIYFVKDATTKSTDSAAIACAAQAANSAVLTKVYLIGDLVDID